MTSALRKWLFAGLLVVLPLAITVWVLQWILGTLDQTLLILPLGWQPDRLIGVHIPGSRVASLATSPLPLVALLRDQVGERAEV